MVSRLFFVDNIDGAELANTKPLLIEPPVSSRLFGTGPHGFDIAAILHSADGFVHGCIDASTPAGSHGRPHQGCFRNTGDRQFTIEHVGLDLQPAAIARAASDDEQALDPVPSDHFRFRPDRFELIGRAFEHSLDQIAFAATVSSTR